MSLTLVIGNKNYSSWSLRPWIAMRVIGLTFGEIVIPLYEPGSREAILKYSPTGKLPVLIDDDAVIWESLAILEYLAETYTAAQLWPADAVARGHARAVASEMHAGFRELRRACPMNMWLPLRARAQSEEVMADVRRIDAIWSDCRVRFGAAGDFLFGHFGAADAMYAPVVARFHHYGIPVSTTAHGYMDAMMALPAWTEWCAAGAQEPWTMRSNEPDWPLVRGEAISG